MAGKYGSPDVFGYVDGYDLQLDGVQNLAIKQEALMNETHGVGDSDVEQTPTGVRRCTAVAEGAFWDTTLNHIHDAHVGSVPVTPQDAVRIMSMGFATEVIGQPFYGIEGAYSGEYEVLAEQNNLQKANVAFAISGTCEEGVILETATRTVDGDTQANSVDNGASSANGGTGYLQVVAHTGFTDAIIKIQDSTDDAVFVDLITFTTVTPAGAPEAERATVSGTVDRYLAVDVDVTGAGSITLFVGFVRNP
jgi:hypothetical protein